MSAPARPMTPAELAAYRRQLQHAIAFFDRQHHEKAFTLALSP